MKLIVVGASAGGLKAISTVLADLPQDFPAPILYVTHLSPQFRSDPVGYLSKKTSLVVEPVCDGTKLLPGHVYVSVPRLDVLVKNARMKLCPPDGIERFCPSINKTLRSASKDFGSRLIAVLMTGRLDDGVDGLKVVYENGGTTIVQNPQEAEFASMPREAILRDHPEFIDPTKDIADRLFDLTQ